MFPHTAAVHRWVDVRVGQLTAMDLVQLVSLLALYTIRISSIALPLASSHNVAASQEWGQLPALMPLGPAHLAIYHQGFLYYTAQALSSTAGEGQGQLS